MTDHEMLIVGGGNAGISLVAKLLRDGQQDVALVESESVHRYRPLLNYVGAGQASMASLERPADKVVPDGCTWIQERVVAVDPDGPSVLTAERRDSAAPRSSCAPGSRSTGTPLPAWRMPTPPDGRGRRSWSRPLRSCGPRSALCPAGRVLFTVPPEPAPCGATALKPLFMACDHWRRTGVLQDLDVRLVLPRQTPLGVPQADDELERTLASYGVQVMREAEVTALADRRVTVATSSGEQAIDDVAFAHVVPHYRAPRWIAESGLAGATAAGLVDVDPLTLRHRRHPADLGSGRRRRPRDPAVRRGAPQAGRRSGSQSHHGRREVLPALRRLHRHADHGRLVTVSCSSRSTATVTRCPPCRSPIWFDRAAPPGRSTATRCRSPIFGESYGARSDRSGARQEVLDRVDHLGRRGPVVTPTGPDRVLRQGAHRVGVLGHRNPLGERSAERLIE